jgi:hypothetical protein
MDVHYFKMMDTVSGMALNGLADALVTAQVERYGPYTAVYGHFTDRITAVISGAEIRRYHNVITVRIRPYTVKMWPRIRCRFTVPKITRKCGPFTAPY